MGHLNPFVYVCGLLIKKGKIWGWYYFLGYNVVSSSGGLKETCPDLILLFQAFVTVADDFFFYVI